MRQRCRHCGHLTNSGHTRGLCWTCWENHDIRADYPSPREWPVELTALLLDLFARGLLYREIARVVGKSVPAVRRKGRRLGLWRRPKRR